MSEETNLNYLLSTPGSLPFLPATGEGHPAQTPRQHDAPGDHHGDSQTQWLGPRQEHEERSQRHQGLPRQNRQVLNTEIQHIRFNFVFFCRLNISSERNNRDKYPDGAYIDIEHHLLRLALVSEVDPRANKKYSPLETPQQIPRPSSVLVSPKEEERVTQLPDSSDDEDEYRLAQTEPSSDEEDIPPISPPNEMGIPEFDGVIQGPQAASSSFSVKTKSLLCVPKLFKKNSEEKGKTSQAKKGLAKGTGYSGYSEKGWDLKAFMAAQRENDRQIQIVLAKILVELQKLHTMTAVKTRNLPDLLFEAAASSSGSSLAPVETVETEEEERGCKRKRKHSPEAETPVDTRSDLYAVLEGSALVPFLESKLQSSSFLEICKF